MLEKLLSFNLIARLYIFNKIYNLYSKLFSLREAGVRSAVGVLHWQNVFASEMYFFFSLKCTADDSSCPPVERRRRQMELEITVLRQDHLTSSTHRLPGQ